jgi:hypothetical protein
VEGAGATAVGAGATAEGAGADGAASRAGAGTTAAGAAGDALAIGDASGRGSAAAAVDGVPAAVGPPGWLGSPRRTWISTSTTPSRSAMSITPTTRASLDLRTLDSPWRGSL